MVDTNNLMQQIKQVIPDFMNNYCIIDNNLWSLEQIRGLDLNEFAVRSFYSLPEKFYKYFPDTCNDKKSSCGGQNENYSIRALMSNEVYLNSPNSFDDVFDSELYVSWEEFEAFRIKTYARWTKCVYEDDMSIEEIANMVIKQLMHSLQKSNDIGAALFMEECSELEQARAKNFALNYTLEIVNGVDLATALKNVIANEYNKFLRDLKNEMRVSCFTTTPFSQLMWGGSYANEHRGFCLEYTVLQSVEYEGVLNNIRPVIYSKARHPITQAILKAYDKNWDEMALRDLYLNGVLRKSLDWAYQNEWRLLLPPEEHGQKGFTKKFFPITKVYLGNRMSADRRKYIICICKEKGIPYTCVTRSSDYYEMQECDVLCEDCGRVKQNIVRDH